MSGLSESGKECLERINLSSECLSTATFSLLPLYLTEEK